MKKDINQPDRLIGICETCKNLSSCTYTINGDRPVQRCEEFEVYSYRPVIEDTPPYKQKLMEDISFMKSRVKKDKPSLNGICKNCDNRNTCMNAKPERIIWHCEEYV